MTWLEQRERLDELPEALEIIDHSDLAPLHAGAKFCKTDLVTAVGAPPLLEEAAEMVHVAGLDAAVAGIDDEAEPRDAVRHGRHGGLRVDDQAQRG